MGERVERVPCLRAASLPPLGAWLSKGAVRSPARPAFAANNLCMANPQVHQLPHQHRLGMISTL